MAVPLQAFGRAVGELCYRRPDRQLSASKLRLIRDLVRHLGGTLHARTLLHDLPRDLRRGGVGKS